MMDTDTERLIAPEQQEKDPFDRALRPRQLQEYIGQDSVREQMDIFIKAAKGRGDALDHVLIFGPPGLGKTTLANIIANELGVSLKQTSGPCGTFRRRGPLTNCKSVMCLSMKSSESSGGRSAVSRHGRLSPRYHDCSAFARSTNFDLPPFYCRLVQRRARITPPALRDRFGIATSGILPVHGFNADCRCSHTFRCAVDVQGRRNGICTARHTRMLIAYWCRVASDYAILGKWLKLLAIVKKRSIS